MISKITLQNNSNSFSRINDVLVRFIKEYWVLLLTFLCGFFTFFTVSVITNSFWFNSSCDFPMITHFTVMFGDSIFLPLLNYRFYKEAKSFVDNHPSFITRNKWAIVIWSVISFVLSYIINSYNHFVVWINDGYTGFFDLKLGELSAAGWFHYAFSVVEMTIVFIFIGFLIITYVSNSERSFKYNCDTWSAFAMYTFLSFPDFMYRQVIFFKNNDLLQALRTDYTSLLLIAGSLAILIVSNAAHKYLLNKLTYSHISFSSPNAYAHKVNQLS